MRRNIIYTCLLLLSTITLSGQSYFQRDSLFSIVQQTSSKNAVSISDLNGDYLDDIQIVDKDNKLITFYQRPDQTFEKVIISNKVMEGEIFSILVADFDQNGRPDIIINGSTVPIMFYQDKIGEFRRDFADFESFLAQGSNAIDIDGDGLLDLFVCDDNAESNTYKNFGSTLDRFDFLNMETDPPSDNSGNYGSIWFDAENDGDLDLYIAKCRAGVEDPSDPRRINALFINEEGQFREAAASFGIDIGFQSWSASAGDIDNDGDEDLLITNHYAKSQVLVNEGDTFSIIELETGDLFPIQGIFSDINLDGYQDILLATISHEVAFINEKGQTFSIIEDFLGEFDKGSSICKGDLNNDGIEDIFAQNAGASFDQVFYGSNPSGNNFLKIDLSSFDDVNATNTTLNLYGPWGEQSRMVRAGESYGINNSKEVIFGLEKFTKADSLKVFWSTNEISTFYDLSANQHLRITQNNCVEQFIHLEQEIFINCDSLVEIQLPDGYVSYEWSDGEAGQIRRLSDGNYYAKLKKQNGCYDQIYPIQIKPYLTINNSGIIDASNTILCSGESITLRSKIEGSYQWSNGQNSSNIDIETPGTYQLIVEDACGEIWEEEISIDEGFLEAPSPISDTIQIGDDYSFDFGEAIILIRDEELNYVNWGKEYSLGALDTSRTFFLSNVDWNGAIEDSLGLGLASNTFASNMINAGINFNVDKTVFLKSVDVYTETPGTRKFIIVDDRGQVTHSKLVDVPSSYSRIPLNFLLLPGRDYTLQTEEEQNLRSFQSPGPFFSRSQNNVEDTVRFPYSIDGSIHLTSTTFGSNNYYYFYNWQVDHDFAFCESERSLAEIIVKNPSNLDEQDFKGAIKIFPNPTTGIIEFRALQSEIDLIRIRTIQGQVVMECDYQIQISIEDLEAGTYLIECIGKDVHFVEKVIKL